MSTDPISKYDSFGRNYTQEREDTYPFIAPKPSDFASRYVLITGASKGIGRATAVSFARAGAAGIAIAARSSLEAVVAEIKEVTSKLGLATPKIIPLQLDVADRAAAAACGATVAREFGGRLDVLVLNAGVLETNCKMLDQDPAEWVQSVQVNLIGTFNCVQAFVPTMLSGPADGLRTVVGLTSIGATLASSGYSSYQPAKLAISRIMEHLINEYGAQEDGGLLAYSVHPGSVPTDMGLTLPKFMLPFMTDKPELPADTFVWLTKERRDWLGGRYISAKWE